ncbi:hypothetical protein [Streptomyces sp. NPDC051567]|uniref:hypothetical protein n=1 Tax=Streptomyces sp. NPDC051567 TaxID=3365660 RepID=UPI0037B203D7
MATTPKRRALILISSARQLPLASPVSVPSVSTGFFLVELAQVLKEFEDTHEFTLATPDGNTPQLDINGMGLAFHAIEKLGTAMVGTGLEQRRRHFTVDAFRRRHADLVERREQELQLLERHLGRLPVSEILPRTDPEAAAFRPELVKRMETLPAKAYHSVQDLVRRHRDPGDAFDFAGLDFVHLPGGHAPMVDFRDDPWIGETLHLARENGAVTSLICHAPVALTSTSQRIDAENRPYRLADRDNPFHGTGITVATKNGEKIALKAGYVAVPGEKTTLTYFVDDALKEAGFKIAGSLNPSAVKLAHHPGLRLITGNGPQTIDRQATEIRNALATGPVRTPA